MKAIAIARGWIDRLLGTVTPTVLVIICLGVIGVVSLVLSAFGRMPFSPVEALASFAITAAGVAGGSWLGAAVTRVKPQVDSMIVTSLVLWCLVLPSLEIGALGGLALAALLAGVSKYLIAWRGRHIFNPAAFGATVVLLLGWVFPSLPSVPWWVGTPPLLPLVAIGAILVLYRTGTFLTGLTFAVVATAGTLLAFLAAGAGLDAWESLQLIIGSTPVIFLAGFMLSEPLTLPPLVAQRIGVAALVGVLYTLPYFGWTPWLVPTMALLAGNLVGFLLGQRTGIRLTVAHVRRLGTSTLEVGFAPVDRVRFTPGQAIELTIPHEGADLRGSRRVLSIVSAPSAPILRVATRIPADHVSKAKLALAALEPGDRITATRIFGDFRLPARGPAVLAAGGIGITPFLSMLAEHAASRSGRDIVVIYRSSDPVPPYLDELTALGARVVLFGQADGPLPPGWVHAGTGRPTPGAVRAAIPDLAERTALVSGPPSFVADLTAMLRDAGVRRIRRDVFSGA